MSNSSRCLSSSNVSFTVEVIHAKMLEQLSSNVFFCYQVHTLLKGLEKIVASVDIPMLVCGDFNSIPSRSVFLEILFAKCICWFQRKDGGMLHVY